MRKRRVGRPSNKELKRERNIKIVGVVSIVFLVGLLLYSLKGFITGDAIIGNVNGTAFKDPVFYKCVVDSYNKEFNKKYGSKHVLTDSQLAQITDVNCGSPKLRSVVGIEKLTKLQYLRIGSDCTGSCEGTKIKSINLSKNTLLQHLTLENNPNLKKINLSNNKELYYASFNQAGIEKLNFANNKNLSDIYINLDNLKAVNLTTLSNLEGLTIKSNSLAKINLSNNKKLSSLSIESPRIKSLNLSNNRGLTNFTNNTGVPLNKVKLPNVDYLYKENNLLVPGVSEVYTGSEKTLIYCPSNNSGYKCSKTIKATNVGTYYTTITPKDGYKWRNGSTSSKNVALKIIPFNISDASIIVNEVGDQTYTGVPIKPEPGVFKNYSLIKKDRDYVFKYSNNVNPGEAKILIKGIGNYTGTKVVTFKIVQNGSATTQTNKTTNTMKINADMSKLNGQCTKEGIKVQITNTNGADIHKIEYQNSSKGWQELVTNINNPTANITIRNSHNKLYFKVSNVGGDYKIFGPYKTCINPMRITNENVLKSSNCIQKSASIIFEDTSGNNISKISYKNSTHDWKQLSGNIKFENNKAIITMKNSHNNLYFRVTNSKGISQNFGPYNICIK